MIPPCPPQWRRSAARIPAWLLFATACCGCTSYRFGNDSLYRPDVRTVFVPVFQSGSFRPFLGERLTEAVAKEIENRTPYKVVSQPNADSILQGRIFEESKFPITENINDELRDIELEWIVEVTWRGRGGEPLARPVAFPLPDGFGRIGQAGHIVPEGGQSLATGQQVVITRLASQIVANMEVPW